MGPKVDSRVIQRQIQKWFQNFFEPSDPEGGQFQLWMKKEKEASTPENVRNILDPSRGPMGFVLKTFGEGIPSADIDKLQSTSQHKKGFVSQVATQQV